MAERKTNPEPGRFIATPARRCFNPDVCLLRLIITKEQLDFPVHLLDTIIKDLKTNEVTLVDLLGRCFTFHVSKLTAVKKFRRLPTSEVKETIDSLAP